MSVLVDSDILIEVTRGKNAQILSQWTELGGSGEVVLYSPVTAAEVWAGARPSEHSALNTLFHALICVSIDAAIGLQAGEYLRQYTKSHSLELGDALIAASARLNAAVLWTRNRKHYPMRDLTFY